MSKISAEHLQRSACVYIRQSTADQLVHNLESQRRQYGLADRAKQLGWTTVEIIEAARSSKIVGRGEARRSRLGRVCLGQGIDLPDGNSHERRQYVSTDQLF